MATSNFVITITLTDTTQVAADNKRDAAVLDFAKAYNLPIYDKDGVTVVPALVAPAVRAKIIQELKDVVIEYRSKNASKTTYDSTRTTENTSLA